MAAKRDEAVGARTRELSSSTVTSASRAVGRARRFCPSASQSISTPWLATSASLLPLTFTTRQTVTRPGLPWRSRSTADTQKPFICVTPLLERMGVPATLFVTTGYVGSVEPFWSDEVAELLLGDRELPERLVLTTQGRRFDWPLTENPSTETVEAVWSLLVRSAS